VTNQENDQSKISIEEFFTYCVDIRNGSLKKKAFLRMLSAYCTNEKDKLRLCELSSARFRAVSEFDPKPQNPAKK